MGKIVITVALHVVPDKIDRVLTLAKNLRDHCSSCTGVLRWQVTVPKEGIPTDDNAAVSMKLDENSRIVFIHEEYDSIETAQDHGTSAELNEMLGIAEEEDLFMKTGMKEKGIDIWVMEEI